jgi:hypothetical protein
MVISTIADHRTTAVSFSHSQTDGSIDDGSFLHQPLCSLSVSAFCGYYASTINDGIKILMGVFLKDIHLRPRVKKPKHVCLLAWSR